ncbi:hypothetical protein B0G62_103164 [Paraburkholderia eburnea]|uniref:Uncharacterized protein n=1 Tax=Paraburkholderia eburnea TaxID=1189126 RepID=A0A2S4MFT4_9BURK|nr:hypothetical protein [Paraburkholderia eburnea]POR53592.1 hypothetical protein B0G62_103164 [Paraburkholderia eburnea]PRZ25560.1 hypothetical protein BX588_102164 [Paraburkholderia eburnea]
MHIVKALPYLAMRTGHPTPEEDAVQRQRMPTSKATLCRQLQDSHYPREFGDNQCGFSDQCVVTPVGPVSPVLSSLFPVLLLNTFNELSPRPRPDHPVNLSFNHAL